MKFQFADADKLAAMDKGLRPVGLFRLRSCVGAMDGLAAKLDCLRKSDSGNSESYYNRKGYFSVNLQAVCDADRRFMYSKIHSTFDDLRRKKLIFTKKITARVRRPQKRKNINGVVVNFFFRFTGQCIFA